jgi:hypothetical protein
MKELVEGHLYELDMFEDTNDDTGNQRIQFIQKVPIGTEGELQTVANGTTNEEVIEMLLHRLNYLQAKFPCRENALAITNLEQALLWLNRRTELRKRKGVEGKQLKH